MTTKTQRELVLEYWGRVYDICDAYNKQHGTSIKPQQCVKHCGGKWNLKEHPMFDGHKYDLAVAIIEGKPVFVGDKIYTKDKGLERIITGRSQIIGHIFTNAGPRDMDNLTLTPPKPKRTFDLNGKQLPCPSNNEFCDTYLLDILGEYYYFESIEDRNNVAQAIDILFNNARDKE